MRGFVMGGGLSYADLSLAVDDGARLMASLDAALEESLARGDKPIRWRMGRGPALTLRRPTHYAGLPIEYEGHGWQVALETEDA